MPPPCRNPANIERNLQEKARATRQAVVVKEIKYELGLPARFGEVKLLRKILEFIQMAKRRRAMMENGAQLGCLQQMEQSTGEYWAQENVAPYKMTVAKRNCTARYNPIAVPSRQPLIAVQEPQEGFNWSQPSTSIQQPFFHSSPADVQSFVQQQQMLEGNMTYNLHPLMAERVSQMINQNTVTPEAPMVQTTFVPCSLAMEQPTHGFYYPQTMSPPVVENQDVMWPSQFSYNNAGFPSMDSFPSSWTPDSPVEFPSFEPVETTGMDGSLTNTNPSEFDVPPVAENKLPSLGSMFNHLCQNLFADGVF